MKTKHYVSVSLFMALVVTSSSLAMRLEAMQDSPSGVEQEKAVSVSSMVPQAEEIFGEAEVATPEMLQKGTEMGGAVPAAEVVFDEAELARPESIDKQDKQLAVDEFGAPLKKKMMEPDVTGLAKEEMISEPVLADISGDASEESMKNEDVQGVFEAMTREEVDESFPG